MKSNQKLEIKPIFSSNSIKINKKKHKTQRNKSKHRTRKSVSGFRKRHWLWRVFVNQKRRKSFKKMTPSSASSVSLGKTSRYMKINRDYCFYFKSLERKSFPPGVGNLRAHPPCFSGRSLCPSVAALRCPFRVPPLRSLGAALAWEEWRSPGTGRPPQRRCPTDTGVTRTVPVPYGTIPPNGLPRGLPPFVSSIQSPGHATLAGNISWVPHRRRPREQQGFWDRRHGTCDVTEQSCDLGYLTGGRR